MTSQKLRVRPVEREFTHELIQRKREMFLVNFALQTKRDQINEYKSRRIAEEYKLKKTAETLQKDAQTFNEFVKANDESAVNAMKASERESRLKLEKITELRRMQTLLGTAKAEISKMDEFLADYLSYKSFLLQVHHNINKKNDEKILTTEQWEARLKNIRKRKAERIKKKKAQEENKRRPSIPARKRQFSISKDAKKSKERMTSPVMSKQLAFTKINFPEEWEEDEIEATKKTERISYLLEDPKFLPNLIRDMEEENLKLILHNQYSEETVDEVKHAYDVTTKKMEKEVKLLRKQVEGLQASIKVTNRRSKSLQIMCHLLDKGVHENGDKALSDLNQKIEEVRDHDDDD
ncbi:unnamed protein product [Clavelina lepadiformis]|uniref:DUF4200 domain-containing protein n=1 Tax=Clavelina lepadiformis TaxID=159417 RepID=A0ABP0FN02_CLALP